MAQFSAYLRSGYNVPYITTYNKYVPRLGVISHNRHQLLLNPTNKSNVGTTASLKLGCLSTAPAINNYCSPNMTTPCHTTESVNNDNSWTELGQFAIFTWQTCYKILLLLISSAQYLANCIWHVDFKDWELMYPAFIGNDCLMHMDMKHFFHPRVNLNHALRAYMLWARQTEYNNIIF